VCLSRYLIDTFAFTRLSVSRIEGMSQIYLKSYSFEVDACTLWHRIDFSKIQLACVGSVLN
jgi:hypothetical protein